MRYVLCIAFAIWASGRSYAKPQLLIELHPHGICVDCSPTELKWFLYATGQQPTSDLWWDAFWVLPVLHTDAGQIFSVPANNISPFNSAFTSRRAAIHSAPIGAGPGDILISYGPTITHGLLTAAVLGPKPVRIPDYGHHAINGCSELRTDIGRPPSG